MISVTYVPAIEKARKGSYILGMIIAATIAVVGANQMGALLPGLFFGAVGGAGYVFFQGLKLRELPSYTFTGDGLSLTWRSGSLAVRWEELVEIRKKGSGWLLRRQNGEKIPLRVLGFEPEDAAAITRRLEARAAELPSSG